MRKVRVFVDAPLQAGHSTQLPAFAAEHLTRVLRLPDSAPVTCFNGDGLDYTASLQLRGRQSAVLIQASGPAAAAESTLHITLAQCVARGEKMDSILQKATELGVAAIVPLISERTEVRLDSERSERRMSHWQRVLHSACEQCGRAVVPRLEQPLGLPAWAAADHGQALLLALDPDAATGIASLTPDSAQIVLVVGPEGGLSDRDNTALQLAEFSGVRLGPRILRTETAAPAMIAVLQARFGDLG